MIYGIALSIVAEDCSTSWFSVMSDAADFEWKLSVLLP
jgi:hypothetical protein